MFRSPGTRRRPHSTPRSHVWACAALCLLVLSAFCADAVRRTAQIAHDTDFDGVAVAYSWPTQGWLLACLIDATAVDTGLVGHVDHGSSPTFLEDLSGVLRGDAPEARGLQREDGVYKLEQRPAELSY